MKVKDVMSKNVVSVNPENSIFDAVTLLAEKKISGAPVVKNNKLVGIVTESNILNAIGKRNLLEIDKKDLERLRKRGLVKIEQVMKKKVLTVKPNEKLRKATLLMNKYNINRLPVVIDKRVVGIITRADIVKVFSKYVTTHPVVKAKPSLILETNIDKLLKLVKERRKIKFSQAAKIFKVSKSQIEEWGKILEDYKLIELHYPTIGEAVLKVKK